MVLQRHYRITEYIVKYLLASDVQVIFLTFFYLILSLIKICIFTYSYYIITKNTILYFMIFNIGCHSSTLSLNFLVM